MHLPAHVFAGLSFIFLIYIQQALTYIYRCKFGKGSWQVWSAHGWDCNKRHL